MIGVLLRLLVMSTSPLFVWDGLEADGRRWSLVGLGAAARLDAFGPDRCGVIRRGAAQLFRRVVELGGACATALPPRLFGGFAFRPEPYRCAPWTAFADASFTLPRWLYATTTDRAFVRVALPSGELGGAGALERELGRAVTLLDACDDAPHEAAPCVHAVDDANRDILVSRF